MEKEQLNNVLISAEKAGGFNQYIKDVVIVASLAYVDSLEIEDLTDDEYTAIVDAYVTGVKSGL